MSFWFVEGPKALTDALYGCKEVEKTFKFEVYSDLREGAFTSVQRMQSFKLGMYHLLMEDIRKGYLFCHKRVKGWT